jgi:[ribosomal protein S5]-alanine N-acetyltransferase
LIIFETARLFTRQFTMADLENLYRFSSDPVVLKYIRPPIDLETTRVMLEEQLNNYKEAPYFGRLAIIEKASQQYIGNFLLRPSASRTGIEIGYGFFDPYWGKGYATELTNRALQFIFKDLHIDCVFAIAAPMNIDSHKVLIKTGFKQLPDFMEDGKLCSVFECRQSRVISNGS